ncbi:MAG TPA: YhjD/YihY/BrkB family envelope integrity protein, partial [Thermoanaerobaculia bacterium]|nr:YhjD/YihY/BrkB family envelope integrity protein [Thermoanaerobaculia bacterium]
MNLKRVWELLKETVEKWQEDEVVELGAALAYYTIFSLAPLLFIAIAIAGLIYGRDAVEGRLVVEIQGLIGPSGARAIETMLAHTWREGSSTLATVVGVLTILFGA